MKMLHDEQEAVENVGSILGLRHAVVERLKGRRMIVAGTLWVEMDSGETQGFDTHLVLHNISRGPGKGGITFQPDVSVYSTWLKAMRMSWKTALLNLPFGGAKHGIIGNPLKLSPREQDKTMRAFAATFREILKPDLDVPAPDRGTNAWMMGRLTDALSKFHGIDSALQTVTGKPIAFRGCPGREEATGRGTVFIAREAAKDFNVPLQGAKVVVEGFGNVGSHAAQFFQKSGCKVIAISDIGGAITDPNGLDIPSLMEYAKKTGGVKNFPGSKPLERGELLSMRCDILSPNALEGTINEKTAREVDTKLIVGAANAHTTIEGNKILAERNIPNIPDFMVGAGGVCVSHLEWQYNKGGRVPKIEEVNAELEYRMMTAYRDVYDFSKSEKLDLQTAANVISIKRVADAIMARSSI